MIDRSDTADLIAGHLFDGPVVQQAVIGIAAAVKKRLPEYGQVAGAAFKGTSTVRCIDELLTTGRKRPVQSIKRPDLDLA